MAGFLSKLNISKVSRYPFLSLKLTEQTFLIVVAVLIVVVVGMGTVIFERLSDSSLWLLGKFLPRLRSRDVWMVAMVPMAAIVMIFEMTNEYRVILPIMIACILAAMLHKSVLKGSIYSLNLSSRGIDIHAGREMGILSSVASGRLGSRPSRLRRLPSFTMWSCRSL